MRHVADRPGHDRRYALDSSKARRAGLGAAHAFDDGLAETVAWYRARESWWRPRQAASSPRTTSANTPTAD